MFRYWPRRNLEETNYKCKDKFKTAVIYLKFISFPKSKIFTRSFNFYHSAWKRFGLGTCCPPNSIRLQDPVRGCWKLAKSSIAYWTSHNKITEIIGTVILIFGEMDSSHDGAGPEKLPTNSRVRPWKRKNSMAKSECEFTPCLP